MIAYEFYWRDGTTGDHFIGILPERRKDPERISTDSILNWGRNVIGDTPDVNDIHFVKVEM
jgi:hypothetical protein